MQIMIDFLNSFKSLIKLEKIHTDNNVFKMHYKFTVIMLIVFSILLTSKQYFGDPIDCDVQQAHKNVINTYCWIFGTYILKNSLPNKVLPGLGNDFNSVSYWNRNLNEDDQVIWQKYYQWVCIVFCFQALLFYIPRYLWKTWEGGRMRLLVKDLGGPLLSSSWNLSTKDKLINYLLEGRYAHNIYAIRYAVCECLNLINVVLQIYLMDWFLTGQFSLYGFAVMTFQQINPMHKVFPKLTKCKYFKFGPSGTEEQLDALCILPLNIVNEKLFLILWFWFCFLALMSLAALIYRILVIFVPRVRVYLIMAQTNYLKINQAKCLIEKLSYGDFFVLYHVGKNTNPLVFKELISGIYDALNNKASCPLYSERGIDV